MHRVFVSDHLGIYAFNKLIDWLIDSTVFCGAVALNEYDSLTPVWYVNRNGNEKNKKRKRNGNRKTWNTKLINLAISVSLLLYLYYSAINTCMIGPIDRGRRSLPLLKSPPTKSPQKNQPPTQRAENLNRRLAFRHQNNLRRLINSRLENTPKLLWSLQTSPFFSTLKIKNQ